MSRPKQRKKCHWYGPSSPKPSVLDWWIPCANPLARQYFSSVFWRSGCFLPARLSSSLADTLNRIAATSGGWPGRAQGGRGGLTRAMWPHVAIKSLADPRCERSATTRFGSARRLSIQLRLQVCASSCVNCSGPRHKADMSEGTRYVANPRLVRNDVVTPD